MPDLNVGDKVVSSLQRDFKIVGTSRIHGWYAWAIVGIVFGMAIGIVYVANRSATFTSSQAAAPRPVSRITVPDTAGMYPTNFSGLGSDLAPSLSNNSNKGSWPAGHMYDFSRWWPKDGTGSWPANHSLYLSENSDPSSWPAGHMYDLSRWWPKGTKWPANHSLYLSENSDPSSWPAGHMYDLSRWWPKGTKWPANHSLNMSNTNPPKPANNGGTTVPDPLPKLPGDKVSPQL